MNDKDQKYEMMINKVKEIKIECPESLTSDIMTSINRTPKKENKGMLFNLVCWASSVAAILLLGLFVEQYFYTPKSNITQSQVYFYSYTEPMTQKEAFDRINNIIKEKKELQDCRKKFYNNLVSNH
jgi:hypothetical protein